ncbi:AEC family transporter [Rickettsia endosymbiont of Cardiosporidium cionae]|uniref:AEC family transporter n=1 Tax=Rickettsia endosymbiont of Cardiosporidium cionae TaxID=2777155 RepID=UPI0018953058|nr:AEC family transporter [Rickettsia endosymbiont of Cardiosporidium cionae]KAF8818708.1 AEC family transporter [Rickettsia endosymbiont of Cardiosporidium cionae]
MLDIFYTVLPIFLIAFLGSVIKRNWLKSDEFWRGLEKLSFYLVFPMVLFENILKLSICPSEITKLIISLMISVLIIAAILMLHRYKTGYDKIQFSSVFQGCVRYNNYILFGLGTALLGDEGLAIISIIAPYMVVFVNISAIIMFNFYTMNSHINKRQQLLVIIRSIITNPMIVSSLIAVLFLYFEIEINIGIKKTITHITNSALTISMMVIGASLKFKINKKYYKQVICTSLTKLCLLPIITYITMKLMSVNGIVNLVGLLFSCMPCSSSAVILSRQLNGDVETMSSTITFSTIFSIFSLSILLYLFR